MKKGNGNKLLLAAAAVGLFLILYPQISNLWNRRTSSHAIASYSETVSNLDEKKYVELWKQAQEYNRVNHSLQGYKLSDEQLEQYNSVLDATGRGIMGYVEIPCIDVSLPVYHGTDEAVLQIALGHVDWTDLPIGGEGTHCVICGHRGLPRAKLFNDLPKLVLGDVFCIRVLDELLTYEVDQIKTVLPDEVDDLRRETGKDYCTLMTCTPYGINSHRLLVRGHRIENIEEKEAILVTSEASQVNPLFVAPVLGILVVIPIILFISVRGKKDSGRTK